MLRSCVGTSRVWVATLALGLVSSTPSRRAEAGILFQILLVSNALELCFAGLCEESQSQSSTRLIRLSKTQIETIAVILLQDNRLSRPIQAHGCEGDVGSENILQVRKQHVEGRCASHEASGIRGLPGETTQCTGC